MTHRDIIKLALSSRKHEKICVFARAKAKWFAFHVRGDLSCLDVGPNTKLFCGTETVAVKQETVSYRDLTKWFDLANTSPLQNLVNLCNKANSIFQSTQTHLIVYMDDTRNPSVQDIMAIASFKNCKNLRLIRGSIKSNDLCYLLDTMKELVEIRVSGTKIPRDFQHERAFNMKHIFYEDANWVTLKNLYTLKHSYSVTLGTTSLKFSDYNKFLKFWINCELDMFINMYIKLEEDIDPNVLFDGMIWLRSRRFSSPFYFIIANHEMKQRENAMLGINKYQGHMTFSAYSRTMIWTSDGTDTDADGTKKTFQLEFDALKVLEQREELSKKMEGMDEVDLDDIRKMKELDNQLNGFLAEGKFTIGV